MTGTDKNKQGLQEGPSIILVEPQLGANIGTAARAMGNFGLNDLRLVAPRDGWPSEFAQKAAAGADWILDAAPVFDTVEEAIADLHFVYATTARPRDMVNEVVTPEQAAQNIRALTAQGQKTGVLFGREKSGLTNDHIALADAILMAPVNPNFASLNLAQCVLLIGYEWFRGSTDSLGDASRDDGGLSGPGLRMPDTWPANKQELGGFFEHLESELDASGFLKPAEKRPAMVRNLRNMFQRTALTEQDVRTLRGVVSSLVKHKKTGKRDG